MSRTIIIPQTVSRAGAQLSSQIGDTVNGNYFLPGNVVLMVSNTTGNTIAMTIHTSVAVDGIIPAPNRNISVPPNSTMMFGPFNNPAYTQSDGTVWVDFGAVIAVTLMAIGT